MAEHADDDAVTFTLGSGTAIDDTGPTAVSPTSHLNKLRSHRMSNSSVSSRSNPQQFNTEEEAAVEKAMFDIRLARAAGKSSDNLAHLAQSSESLSPRNSFKVSESYKLIDKEEEEEEQRKEEKAKHHPEAETKWTPPEWERADLKMFHTLGYCITAAFLYTTVVFLLGFELTMPDGPLWATVFLWFCSYMAGILAGTVGIPPLLGQLLCGLILRNLPGDEVFLNLPTSWTNQIKAFGLCIIFIRSGLELDIPAIIKQGMVSMRLTVCPGIVEALVVGGVAAWRFGMPFDLAVTLGFVLAAVSPAVVVTGMFDLHHRGYGVAKGIPSLVVAAASFDDVVALTGFSVAIGSAIPSDHSKILTFMHAPIEVFGAVILGVLAGSLIGCTVMWNKHWKRLVIILAVSMCLMFFAVFFHYNSMGALGSLVTGVVAAMCWSEARMGTLSLAPNSHYKHEIEADVALLWKYLAQPMLFAVIGASIDFSEIEASTIPNSIMVIVIGVVCRMLVAMTVTYGAGLTTKERIFIGMTWIPKATVQAALGSIPLALIEENLSPDDDNYEEYEKWGKDILVTAVFAILITAPIGVICIDYFGPRWLEKLGEGEADDAMHDKSEAGNQKHFKDPIEEQYWIIGEAARRVDVEVQLEVNLAKLESFFSQMRAQLDNVTYNTNNNAIDAATANATNKGNQGLQNSVKMLREGIAALEEQVYEANLAQEFNADAVFNLAASFVTPSHIDVDPISGRLRVASDSETGEDDRNKSSLMRGITGTIQAVRRRSSGSAFELTGGGAAPTGASSERRSSDSGGQVRRSSGSEVELSSASEKLRRSSQ